MLGIDPEEVFSWDGDSIDAALKQLDVTVGTKWIKTKKAKEFNSVLEKMKIQTKARISVLRWPRCYR